MKIVIPIVVGLLLCPVVYFLMASYTWTAIHSGWSQAQINAFYRSIDLVPPVVGFVAALATYRLIRAKP